MSLLFSSLTTWVNVPYISTVAPEYELPDNDTVFVSLSPAPFTLITTGLDKSICKSFAISKSA